MANDILQFFVGDTGQDGENPRKVRLVTKASLATITTAGFLDNIVKLQGKALLPTDEVHCWYGATSMSVPGTFGIFNPVISNGVITLNIWENPGNVLLPVVSGNSAAFIGTAGQIQDSGISATAPTYATATITTLTSTTSNITNLKYGATPVAQVDPASCTIAAVSGAANTATVTIQLKDGSGTNMTRIIPFRVYASSASTGLTLASAASTGFSVASGGLSLNNGAAITTQISAMSSATGGCVLSLLDTGKQTSYLVLVLANGTKISAQLSAGSYG